MVSRRSTRPSRRSRRRTVRRRTTRTRRSTRVNRRRARPSVRRITDITATKKQDNMLQWVPTDPTNNPSGAGTPSSIEVIAAATSYGFLYCPTARRFEDTQNDMSDRNRQYTFARGYKEVSTLKVQGGIPWRRRRIAFSIKGLPSQLLSIASSFIPGFFYKFDSTVGVVRQMALLPSAQRTALQTILFKGSFNEDWLDPMLAKVDTQRVTLHSDTITSLNPGNSNGTVRVLKQWYPLNKTLCYQDDEDGSSTTVNEFSTQSKVGMGDFFIYDIYESVLVDPAQKLQINQEGTYYWHEK